MAHLMQKLDIDDTENEYKLVEHEIPEFIFKVLCGDGE